MSGKFGFGFDTNEDSGGSGSSRVYTFKRVFTPAEWRNLFSSNIDLISAQGEDSIICIIANTVSLKYQGGTQNYNFSGGTFDILIGGGATIASSSDTVNYSSGVIFGSFGDTGAGVANAKISISNTTADATEGDRIPVLSFNYFIMDLSQ